MTDIVDLANDLVELRLQEAIASCPRHTGPSATHCEECDDVIPERRRKALPGVQTCTFCQGLLESRASKRGSR